MRTLSTRQARRFLLLKNGLIGGYRFKGKQGALDYVRQAGCVQYTTQWISAGAAQI